MLPRRLVEPLRRQWRLHLLRQAIPATAEDDLRPCLVLSPHPDDEVLGAGSTILRRALRGTRVTVVHVSLGERSHPGVPPRQLAAVRRDEAVRAAGLMGVDDVRFLELPDGSLHEHLVELVRTVVSLLRELRPVDLIAPAPGESHPDHEAVAEAVRQAVGESVVPVRLLDFYVWYWSHWPWQHPGRHGANPLAALRQELTRPVLVVDGRPVREHKLDALAAYSSQTGAGGAGLPAEVLARAADDYELLGLARLNVVPVAPAVRPE